MNAATTPNQDAAAARLILAGRLLALAGVLVALALFLFFMDNFNSTGQIIFAAWAALPIPLAWWIGRKLARGTAALAVLVAGLALLWTLAAWLYWDAFLGPSSRTESLAGLIVLFAPVYQWVGIAVTLLIAWLIGRAAQPATKPE
jgi:hypothetical protein